MSNDNKDPALEGPKDLEWIQGDLPKDQFGTVVAWIVHSKPKKLVKKANTYREVSAPELEGKFKSIECLTLSKDHITLTARFTPVGFEEKVTYYAWIKHEDTEISTGDIDSGSTDDL